MPGSKIEVKRCKKLTIYVIVLALAGFGLTPVSADGGDSGGGSRLAPFQKLIKSEKCQQAITELDEALRDSPDDADLSNLVAYSHRKLGHFEIALENYL